jgi:TonB family protein
VLAVGLLRLARLASNARRLSDGVWVDSARQICQEYGVRRHVTLLHSHHPSLLVTWGLWHPKILLPAAAARWDADRVRVVLAHELAHVRRRDWPFQLAAESLRCLYWFNPLVWLACRRLRQESEQACDDAVMNRGVDGAEYATHLVQIARELHSRGPWVPAPSIARSTTLERRIKVMLDSQVNRRPLSRLAGATALLGLLAVTIPVTGVVVAQAFGTVGGSIVDPMNGALPGVTLVLTNTQSQAKYEVRSDRAGRYEFVGLTAGEYLLEAQMPGFAVLRGRLTVAGQSVQQDLKLEVGTLSESITVRAKAGSSEYALTTVNQPARDMAAIERTLRQREQKCVSASPGAASGGGNLQPPLKLRDVRPYYPPSAVNAGVEGAVVLRGRIGTDGTIDEVNVVSSPHPDLSQSATEAVREWQFTPTLLNCAPIAVNIGITVTYQREQ